MFLERVVSIEALNCITKEFAYLIDLPIKFVINDKWLSSAKCLYSKLAKTNICPIYITSFLAFVIINKNVTKFTQTFVRSLRFYQAFVSM